MALDANIPQHESQNSREHAAAFCDLLLDFLRCLLFPVSLPDDQASRKKERQELDLKIQGFLIHVFRLPEQTSEYIQMIDMRAIKDLHIVTLHKGFHQHRMLHPALQDKNADLPRRHVGPLTQFVRNHVQNSVTAIGQHVCQIVKKPIEGRPADPALCA